MVGTKILKGFLSVVLAAGLCPSVAFAQPNEEATNGVSALTVVDTDSGDSVLGEDHEQSGSNDNDIQSDVESSTDSGTKGNDASDDFTQDGNENFQGNESDKSGLTPDSSDGGLSINEPSENYDEAKVSQETESSNSDNDSNTDEISDGARALEKFGYVPADNIEDGQYLLQPSSNMDLTFSPTALNLNSTETPRDEIFSIDVISEDSIQISNQQGKILTAGTNDVLFTDENGSDSQKWQFFVQSQSDSNYAILNIATNKVLDISSGRITQGTKVGLYQPNGTVAQQWQLFDAGQVIEKLDKQASGTKNLLSTDQIYWIETTIEPNMVIDVSGASSENDANVQLYRFNNTAAQQWTVSYDEQGYVTFINVQSGKALDVQAGKGVSGANVRQYTPNGTYAQKWIVSQSSDGSYEIKSALWQGLSLDLAGGSVVNKTNIRLYHSNDTAAQRFNIVTEDMLYSTLDEEAAANAGVLKDGTYLINSSLANDKVLDVANASLENAANVQLYTSNMTKAQQWTVSHDAMGYITFTNVGSEKVLDVASGNILPGTNVRQYASNESRAQKWIALPNEDGTFRIKSALGNDIVLDISKASASNKANVQTYTSNGTIAQKFNFIDVNPVVDPCQDCELGGKYYKVVSALDGDYVLDVAKASLANGANIQLYKANESYAQLYKFEFIPTPNDQSKGYYQIINARSGKALDVQDGNLVNKTNIQQWEPDSANPNQLFSLVQNKDYTYTFINKGTGLVLDVSGAVAKNGSNIQGYNNNDSNAQRFVVEEVSDLMPEGVVSLYSDLNSSKVVDVESGSLSSGANVQLYTENGSLAQKWNCSKVGNNVFTLQSLRSGMNLAVDASGNVCQQTPSDSKAQQWIPTISNGLTVLKNAQTGKVLDVKNGSSADGTNIQTYENNGTAAQRFNVVSVDILAGGTYFIQALKSPGFVMDVSGASSSDGANVQLYSNNDSGAQKWNVTKNGDGTYTFKNAANGKALDLKSANATSGSNIQQWTANGSAAQKWNLQYMNGGGIRIVSAVNPHYSIGISGNAYINKANIELQSNATSDGQRFTFEPTKYVPPLPSDRQAMLDTISNYSSGTQWLIAVDRSTHKVGVFKGSMNNWSYQYYWSCVTGAPGTPTITGDYYTTGFKRTALTTDSRALWATQIWGGYFFHSILASTSELGNSLSHGCIRLDYSDALWIYNNIYAGTRVVIYG